MCNFVLEFDTRPFSIFVASMRTWWAATLNWFRTTSPAIDNVTQFWWERSSWSLTAAAGGSCLPDMGTADPCGNSQRVGQVSGPLQGSTVWKRVEGYLKVNLKGERFIRRSGHQNGTQQGHWDVPEVQHLCLLGLGQLQWAIIIAPKRGATQYCLEATTWQENISKKIMCEFTYPLVCTYKIQTESFQSHQC